MSLINLRNITFGFIGPPLLDGVNLTIEPGERVCLVGRNGEGKSTLMRLIHGDLEPDQGEVIRSSGVKTAVLDQQVPVAMDGTIFDQVANGLAKQGALLAEYHRVSHRLATEGGSSLRKEFDRLGHELDIHGGWEVNQRVEAVISRMRLDPDAPVDGLSAGMKRRVLLARALVSEPELLLLDEPTNHLDVEAICWLEEFLARLEGALLFVTHDRMLVRRLATRILDLDRGDLTSWECGYDTYVQRKEAALDSEARQRALFDKKLAQEEAWIRKGILARRTRNEGRVRALKTLRETHRTRRERPETARMRLQEAERSGRLVIEAKAASFAYQAGPAVVADLWTFVMRGDRIGIIGPNGSGKTTLMRLLLGELTPTAGSIRHGTGLEVAYFDQLHAQLDEEKSVAENVADGSDSVLVQGRKKHIYGYLQDFLFSPDRAKSPVKQLSGGERNRLLLAKLFTKPANLLALDEPTNDLDAETLELLEELLLEYSGTILLVSHDREFLNNVVTSTLVLEGQAQVKEYAGGYDDWIAQSTAAAGEPSALAPEKSAPKPDRSCRRQTERSSAGRLTYNEKRELQTLPGRIEELEAQIEEIHETMAAPSFYQKLRHEIVTTTEQEETLRRTLEETYARWETLEARNA